MLSREKNELGIISLDEELLDRIILDSLLPHEGKIWIASFKGQDPDQLPKHFKTDGSRDVTIRCEDGKIYIKLFAIVSFGQSISSICKDIINSIADGITSCLEMEIDDIVIVVSGVAAKKIAPRRVVCRYKTIRGRMDKDE